MTTRMRGLLLAALVGVAFWIVTSAARPQDKRDPLDEAKQRQQAEIERVEADFQKVYDAARVVSVKEPAKAIAMLRDFRDTLTANPDIPQDKRDLMLRRLKVAIDAYATRAADLKEPQLLPPLTKPDKTPIDDMVFPKDWTIPRPPCSQKNAAKGATKEEVKILKALSTPMTVELEKSTLEDVIKYLQDKADINIVVPQTILEEKNITYKVPVSVNLKNVTLRTILKKVLADLGLTYVIKDNAIQVTTDERARQSLSKRAYSMSDMQSLTDLRIPRFAREAQVARMIDDMIGVVVGTIDPPSWSVNGGPGKIEYEPSTKSFLVTQTWEVHLLLGVGKPVDDAKEKPSDSSSKANPPARRQEDRDILKENKEREEAERQRAAAKCQEAHDEATKEAGAHPGHALMILKTMRKQIESDADLSPKDQIDLERWLDYRIRWLTLRIQSTESLRDWLNHGTPDGKSL